MLRLMAGENSVLSIHTDDPVQLYVSVAEWGAANVRLMADLLAQGRLKQGDIEYYLAHTAYILDLASHYEWQSLLTFDMRYHEIQEEYGQVWGQRAPHLEAQLLTPRRQAQHQISLSQDSWKGSGRTTGTSKTPVARGPRPAVQAVR